MTHIMQYRPYSPEWHRYRYLKEAIDKYLDDYIAPEVVLEDISDILHERSERAYGEFSHINEIEAKLNNRC